MNPKGDEIRRLRREAGLAQADLAEACDVSASFISRVETSHRMAKRETLVAIAGCLSRRLKRKIELEEIAQPQDSAYAASPFPVSLPASVIDSYAADTRRWWQSPSSVRPGELVLEGDAPAFPWHRLETTRTESPPAPVTVYALHDGNRLPQLGRWKAAGSGAKDVLSPALIDEVRKQRDWGASAVARAVAGALNLTGFGAVELARPFVDYGRMPGVTQASTPHLRTKSLSASVAALLEPAEVRACIEAYDRCATDFEAQVRRDLGLPTHEEEAWRADGADVARCGRIFLEVHTCDDEEVDGERRPEVAVIFRTDPTDEVLHDPWVGRLIPPKYYRFTADRLLPVRMVQNLEYAGYYTGINAPYHLPKGSVGVRLHRWAIAHILSRFIALKHEESKEAGKGNEVDFSEFVAIRSALEGDGSAWKSLWSALANPNTRNPRARLFVDYMNNRCNLGALSEPTRVEMEGLSALAGEVERFLRGQVAKQRLEDWRWSPERMNVVVLEVRKGVIWSPEAGLDAAKVEEIAGIVAKSLLDYLDVDRPKKASLAESKGR